MNSKKVILILVLIFASSKVVFSQDYFEDLNGNGFPILMETEKDLNLFARINIGDNSFKLSTFQFFKDVKFGLFGKPNIDKLMRIGWGTYFKAKTENGIGYIFSSGKFTPGFSSGGYFYLGRTIDYIYREKIEKRWWHLIFSFGYNFSKYRYYEPDKEFENQLTQIDFGSINLGLSYYYNQPSGKNRDSNLIWGGSISYSKINNYSSLDKFEIKDSTSFIDTDTDTERTVTSFNEDGYVYAKGSSESYYKEFLKCKIRPYLTLIPKMFYGRIGIILYPSIDILKRVATQYDIKSNGEIENTNPFIVGNFGIGLQLFDDDQRSYSLGGVFIEFNDLNNAYDSKKSFFKRSLKIGVTASLNILSLKN